jgi:sortase (surface protein transpeptidase)
MVVRVPRLGIRGRLQRLDLASGHRLRVPADPRRVGWWSGGALPGTPGSTVLAGHVDGPAGPAVFNRLVHARRGDLITISTGAGRPLRYRVTAVRSYGKGRLPRRAVFGASNANRLRLVTCGGHFDPASGHYDENVVVYARPI